MFCSFLRGEPLSFSVVACSFCCDYAISNDVYFLLYFYAYRIIKISTRFQMTTTTKQHKLLRFMSVSFADLHVTSWKQSLCLRCKLCRIESAGLIGFLCNRTITATRCNLATPSFRRSMAYEVLRSAVVVSFSYKLIDQIKPVTLQYSLKVRRQHCHHITIYVSCQCYTPMLGNFVDCNAPNVNLLQNCLLESIQEWNLNLLREHAICQVISNLSLNMFAKVRIVLSPKNVHLCAFTFHFTTFVWFFLLTL